ncbi:uncharacterized protein LOC142761763 isoform X2 [Rhipicephalus microplus]|uniref:uncharacterized protein LOC142761763 isoform X2 n=1 Tax=Rhipicephalus microplus TaxID=6941 RepID=UPI003F6BBBFE
MKSLEEDAVQAQAMLAHMTEGVEARPVSPLFKAVDINIDDAAENQTPREHTTRDAYDDENRNNLSMQNLILTGSRAWGTRLRPQPRRSFLWSYMGGIKMPPMIMHGGRLAPRMSGSISGTHSYC